MTGHKAPQEFDLTTLFTRDRYIVPVYQRNYAWGEEQIGQLIQDIWDAACTHPHSPYYIGTLVVHARDAQGNHFEVIDGQQRHTTLSLLLAALRTLDLPSGLKERIPTRTNLEYDSRNQAKVTLRNAFETGSLEEGEPSFHRAYDAIRQYLKNPADQKIDLSRFMEYLLEQVHILRVVVPPDTDLNHYFEIMNNRSEQLEKHEIVKARLMERFSGESASLEAFAAIWDACSDMSRHVQYGFSKDVRHLIFGQDLQGIPARFDEISDVFAGQTHGDNPTILECLDSSVGTAKVDSSEARESDRFTAVVTFPNFLLHALRIRNADAIRSNRTSETDVRLDDKSLLESFKGLDDADEIKRFAVLLLRLRILLDKYVIKREADEKWSLKQLRWYDRHDNLNYVDTFEDKDAQQRIIHLLAMLHVSFPSPIYKHWLTGVLLHLHESPSVDPASYLRFLESFDSRLFFGRHREKPREYLDILFCTDDLGTEFDENLLSQGTLVPNYAFNRMDYLIWKCNRQDLLDASDPLRLDKGIQDRFQFGFRSSVEHYYPQNPIGGESLATGALNSFGNLCLISHHRNSRLSNHLPSAKKDFYRKQTSVESLKQQLMMKYDSWGPDESGLRSIREHEDAVLGLIRQKTEHLARRPTRGA